MIYAGSHGVIEKDSPLIEIEEPMLVRLAGVRAFGQGLHCFEEGGVRDVVTTETKSNAIVQEGRHFARKTQR